MSEEQAVLSPYFRKRPYTGVLTLLSQVMGLSVLAACFLAVPYVLYLMVVDPLNNLQNLVGFWAFWLCAVLFAVAMFNHYSTLWLTEEGIYVSFGSGRKLVPWNEVKAVKSLSTRWQGKLVLVKHLPPLYYLHGNIYFSPGFLIDPTIKEYREVVATIQEQIQASR